MARTYTGRFQLNCTGTYTKDDAVGNDIVQTVSESITKTITSGSGADMCSRVIKKTGTATTTPAALVDLSGTSTDDFGDTTDAAEVLAVLVQNTGASVNLLIGGESADITWCASGSEWIVPPNGFCFFYTSSAAGMPVTATTADKISGQSASSTTTYEITVWYRP